MKLLALLLSMIATLGFAATGCTVTHTEAQLQAGERHQDAIDRSEEERDREIGEEGGINQEEIDDEVDWIESDTDL
jgi:hypothetical protein